MECISRMPDIAFSEAVRYDGRLCASICVFTPRRVVPFGGKAFGWKVGYHHPLAVLEGKHSCLHYRLYQAASSPSQARPDQTTQPCWRQPSQPRTPSQPDVPYRRVQQSASASPSLLNHERRHQNRMTTHYQRLTSSTWKRYAPSCLTYALQ